MVSYYVNAVLPGMDAQIGHRMGSIVIVSWHVERNTHRY